MIYVLNTSYIMFYTTTSTPLKTFSPHGHALQNLSAIRCRRCRSARSHSQLLAGIGWEAAGTTAILPQAATTTAAAATAPRQARSVASRHSSPAAMYSTCTTLLLRLVLLCAGRL